jgi:hypothetical protein
LMLASCLEEAGRASEADQARQRARTGIPVDNRPDVPISSPR